MGLEGLILRCGQTLHSRAVFHVKDMRWDHRFEVRRAVPAAQGAGGICPSCKTHIVSNKDSVAAQLRTPAAASLVGPALSALCTLTESSALGTSCSSCAAHSWKPLTGCLLRMSAAAHSSAPAQDMLLRNVRKGRVVHDFLVDFDQLSCTQPINPPEAAGKL